MTENSHPGVFVGGSLPAGAVSARTLIAIRWVALAGQIVAILVVEFGLRFPLPLSLCLGIVAASAVLNLAMQARARTNQRLSDRAAALSLGFDIAQSAALLYVTGGMENPFSLLLLAPVAISATILSLRSTIWLCLLALAAATLLMLRHLPLPWDKAGLELPELYIFGIWTALVIAIVFSAAYTWRVADEARRMSDALAATQMALAREQQLSALGGLAAAAAHELGSPLSTIAVIAADLARDVPADSEFAEDIELLRSESARCRAILAGLSNQPEIGGGDPYVQLSMSTLIDLAAAPHQREGVEIIVERHGPDQEDDSPEAVGDPMVIRSPEILHGLGTLIQNAVQFAVTTVEVTVAWDHRDLVVIIEDDGPGFPATMLDRLGEPYLSTRGGTSGHMGLGIFIANTLLERTGGRLTFGNRLEGGARAEARWLRATIEPSARTP
jgi:two-component system, sensor histidine kinase RegB